MESQMSTDIQFDPIPRRRAASGMDEAGHGPLTLVSVTIWG